jgi:group I intron endonuclease
MYPSNFEKTTTRVSGIYSITHPDTGKVYIGSSSNIFRRWRGHFIHLERGVHANAHLQYAWAKHGSAEFTFCVLEQCAADQLIEREQFYIDSVPVDLRYNLSPVSGSVRGMKWTLSTESRLNQSRGQRLLSDAQILEAKAFCRAGETYASVGKRYGVALSVIYTAVRGGLKTDPSAPIVGVIKRKRTPEMRARMRVAALNRAPAGEETRKRISAANIGRTFTDEWRAKLSTAAKTRVYTPEWRANMAASKRASWAAKRAAATLSSLTTN